MICTIHQKDNPTDCWEIIFPNLTCLLMPAKIKSYKSLSSNCHLSDVGSNVETYWPNQSLLSMCRRVVLPASSKPKNTSFPYFLQSPRNWRTLLIHSKEKYIINAYCGQGAPLAAGGFHPPSQHIAQQHHHPPPNNLGPPVTHLFLFF